MKALNLIVLRGKVESNLIWYAIFVVKSNLYNICNPLNNRKIGKQIKLHKKPQILWG